LDGLAEKSGAKAKIEWCGGNILSINAEMKAAFDTMAVSWTNNEKDYAIRERLTALIGLEKDSVIADIGCGKGVMLLHLLNTMPHRIYAVDISSEMIKRARELFADRRISFVNDDILTASLPMLDAAVIFNAYPHFIHKEALAKKLALHVKRGGCAVIAHSRSRHRINSLHKNANLDRLSVPLKAADIEAETFLP
jgi:demethylmenaquinone methyltransferase/2-methoxy-6-polyprenyl-1,4-benzoquinol methylase